MPSTPFIISGTVSDRDSTAKSNLVVVAHNTTTGEKVASLNATDSLGHYIIDLANLNSGWTLGDSVTIYVRWGGWTGDATFSVSGTAKTQDVTVYGGTNIATLRTNLWDVMYWTLQSGYYAISTNNIHSAMNDTLIASEGYPQVIVYPVNISTKPLSVSKTLLSKKVTFRIEIYHTSTENLKVLTDEVEYKINTALTVWRGVFLNNLEIPTSDYDWWDDNKTKIHFSTLEIMFDYVGEL